MQRVFTDRLNNLFPEWRGGQCIVLDLSGASEKDILFKKTVLTNIRCVEANVKLNSVPVARHHWSVEALKFFSTTNTKKLTPVAYNILARIQHTLDVKNFVHVDGVRLYFIAPNTPHDVVQRDSRLLGKDMEIFDRNERQRNRDSNRTKQLAEQNEKRLRRRRDRLKRVAQQESCQREAELQQASHRMKVALRATTKLELAKTLSTQKQTIESLQCKVESMESELVGTVDAVNALEEQLKEEQDAANRQIQSLKAQLRRERRKKKNVASNKSSMQRQDSGYQQLPTEADGGDEAIDMVQAFLVCHDGPSRLSLTDSDWYALRPTAAQTLFGFCTFDKLKRYVLAFFRNVQFIVPKLVRNDGRITVDPIHPTEFEQIILVKFFLHACPNRTKLGITYNLHRTTITKYLKKWAPLWGKYGEHLSILPMPHDYFRREMPDEIMELGLVKCAFMFDGKDTLTETVRKDDPMKRRLQSKKMHSTAARWLNFMSMSGLSFEHTRAYGGRASEVSLTEIHGDHSQNRCALQAPIESWRNYAKTNPVRPVLKYWTLLDNVAVNLQQLETLEPKLDVEEAFGGSATVDDGESNRREFAADKDEFVMDADKIFHERRNKIRADKQLQQMQERKETTLTREYKHSLHRQMDTAFNLSPQNDPEELLQQLELHENLHQLYEHGKLKKCMFSAYLYLTSSFRQELLVYLGSNMFGTSAVSAADCIPPTVWTRLAKTPPGAEGLADKGFDKTDRFFPFFNAIRTPRVLRGRRVKQYHEDELEPKRILCRARYVNEVGFSRVVDLDVLKDVVPYENICVFPFALEWAHAHLNLGLPLRRPGSNSGLPQDYWE